MKLKIGTGLFLFFYLVNFSFASETDSAVVAKNELSVRRSLHSFFDGSPMWQPLEDRIPFGIFMNSAGIGYRRNIAGNNFIGITCDFYRYYNGQLLSQIDTGSALNRSFVDVRVDYSRRVLQTEMPLLLDLGLSYRVGSETFLDEYEKLSNGNHIAYMVTHDLKNFGMSTGLTYTYRDWTNVRIHFQLKYTGYFYLRGGVNPSYSAERKPTSHMLNFGVIVGIGK